MFTKYSFAGVGWVVTLLMLAAKYAGFDLDEGQATELANNLILLWGLASALIGQLLREDLVAGLVRKKPLE